MIAALKALHIAALAIWVAGLLALPVLMQRHGRGAAMRTQAGFAAFRWLSHYSYTRVVSPAAVVAVAAGTALILADAVLAPWMLAKLLAVAGMVLIHAWLGHVIVLIGEGRGAWRMPPIALLLLPVLVALVALVLWLVLAKPDLQGLIDRLPEALLSPRGQPLPPLLEPL